MQLTCIYYIIFITLQAHILIQIYRGAKERKNCKEIFCVYVRPSQIERERERQINVSGIIVPAILFLIGNFSSYIYNVTSADFLQSFLRENKTTFKPIVANKTFNKTPKRPSRNKQAKHTHISSILLRTKTRFSVKSTHN